MTIFYAIAPSRPIARGMTGSALLDPLWAARGRYALAARLQGTCRWHAGARAIPLAGQDQGKGGHPQKNLRDFRGVLQAKAFGIWSQALGQRYRGRSYLLGARDAPLVGPHLPQRALDLNTPIQALKKWQAAHPDSFAKRVVNHPGPDT